MRGHDNGYRRTESSLWTSRIACVECCAQSNVTLNAIWKNFEDVKKTFRATDIYGDCVIFDVGGNNYRLIAKINYETEQVSIKAVMTHAEYDKDKWKGDC